MFGAEAGKLKPSSWPTRSPVTRAAPSPGSASSSRRRPRTSAAPSRTNAVSASDSFAALAHRPHTTESRPGVRVLAGAPTDDDGNLILPRHGLPYMRKNIPENLPGLRKGRRVRGGRLGKSLAPPPPPPPPDFWRIASTLDLDDDDDDYDEYAGNGGGGGGGERYGDIGYEGNGGSGSGSGSGNDRGNNNGLANGIIGFVDGANDTGGHVSSSLFSLGDDGDDGSYQSPFLSQRPHTVGGGARRGKDGLCARPGTGAGTGRSGTAAGTRRRRKPRRAKPTAGVLAARAAVEKKVAAAAQAVVDMARKKAREERKKERANMIRERKLEAKAEARKADLRHASQSFMRNTFCLFCGEGSFPLDCGCRWLNPLVVIDNKIVAMEWKVRESYLSRVNG